MFPNVNLRESPKAALGSPKMAALTVNISDFNLGKKETKHQYIRHYFSLFSRTFSDEFGSGLLENSHTNGKLISHSELKTTIFHSFTLTPKMITNWMLTLSVPRSNYKFSLLIVKYFLV